MNEDQQNLVGSVILIVLFCVLLLCLFCLEYGRDNNDHPTQPPRSFHELIQAIHTIEPTVTVKCKPPPPRPIPVVKFNSRNFQDVVECVVCLSKLVDGEKARVLPTCKHCFHVYCIDKWLKSNSSCPVCRENVVGRLILNHGSIYQPLPSVDANSDEVMVIDIPVEPETRDGQSRFLT